MITGRSTSPSCELTVLHYCEAHEIPPIDVWWMERHQLSVAGEDAFPLLQRSLSEQRFRRPTRSELLDLDIALRSLPAFAEQPVSATLMQQTCATFQGSYSVRMRWLLPS